MEVTSSLGTLEAILTRFANYLWRNNCLRESPHLNSPDNAAPSSEFSA